MSSGAVVGSADDGSPNKKWGRLGMIGRMGRD